jgi:hypothetical protein
MLTTVRSAGECRPQHAPSFSPKGGSAPVCMHGRWDIRPTPLGEALYECHVLDYDLVRQVRLHALALAPPPVILPACVACLLASWCRVLPR